MSMVCGFYYLWLILFFSAYHFRAILLPLVAWVVRFSYGILKLHLLQSPNPVRLMMIAQMKSVVQEIHCQLLVCGLSAQATAFRHTQINLKDMFPLLLKDTRSLCMH